MRKYCKLVFMFFILSQAGFCQSQRNIYGFVYDSLSAYPLINASVFIDGSRIGTYTNHSGWFSLETDADTGKLVINYLGYKTSKISLKNIFEGIFPLKIVLIEQTFETRAVVINADKYKNEKRLNDLGYHQLTNAVIKHFPSLGGECDPVKIMQLLPGVSTSKEGSAELHVRGGENDQNLITIDGAQVYNPMHIFGYFSTFNSDAINSAEMMKGYISPEFNGKLSSVISYNLKDGNNTERRYSGGISLLSSQFMTEGPLSSRVTYMLSARRSYLDPVFALISSSDGLSFSFYDIYAKVMMQASNDDRFYLSTYYGSDDLTLLSKSDDGTNLNWNNAAVHFRWNRIWNSKVFSNSSIIYSKYSNELTRKNINKNPFIQELTIKSVVDYRVSPSHFLQFGGDLRYFNFNVTSGVQELSNLNNYSINAVEGNLFLQGETELFGRLKIRTGFPISFFRETATNKAFYDFGPRIGLSYHIDKSSSLKLTFSRLHQYIQQLSSVNLYNPADVFYPSNNNLAAVSGNQISAGITKIVGTEYSEFIIDFDAFYRDMQNLSMFRQNFKNADPMRLSDQLILGKGWGYGIELQVEKKEGAITGWINYSWANSLRLFAERNEGRTFHPKFHVEHQLNLAVNYNMSDALKLNAVLVVASGNPVTLPNQKFFVVGESPNSISNIGELDYGEINGYRLPMYHRLDLGIVHSFKMWGYRWELFGNVYNIYNHKNNTFISYENTRGKYYSFTVGILPTAGVKFYF